ncbi:MAG: carboxypeptidase M32 [Pirellulales bacterium]|nr:carboxypeptidase M32 [Pirellulales bacterium]
MKTIKSNTYARLCDHVREIALVQSIESLLEWDERTGMPPAAGPYRAEQMSHLAGRVHQLWTDPRMAEWLAELADSPLVADHDSDAAVTLRELRRLYDKKVRLPQKLVEELTRAAVLGQQAWAVARRANDFEGFRPLLERIVALKREEAAAFGFTDSPYDPLLDEYEPGAKTAEVSRVLAALADELVPLLTAIVNATPRAKGAGESTRKTSAAVRAGGDSALDGDFPLDVQATFARLVAEQVGFDFNAGRIDVSAHPFCTQLGPHDHRLTTRYSQRDMTDAIFSILHEVGHGLYQQGLPPEHFGLPLGEAISLGIHESQSRLWENLVGRSRAYWEWLFSQAQHSFPQALTDTTLDEFYRLINQVRPSLVRIEADEVTYNLHILVRFELEQELLTGDLEVADLPDAWHDRYHHYLGVTPQNHAEGVLQDIHWSAGAIGYFPTYSLGNLYAAQFFEQAEADLGSLDEQFRRGQFAPLREWLVEQIHRHGRRYSAADLVERVTGRPLSHEPLMRHFRRKFGPLYGMN